MFIRKLFLIRRKGRIWLSHSIIVKSTITLSLSLFSKQKFKAAKEFKTKNGKENLPLNGKRHY
jgi:hypothetical protein